MHHLGIEQSVSALLVEDARNAISVRYLSVKAHHAGPANDYSKLPCSRRAIGASGSMITLHALGTSTSCIAFRLILLAMDRDPRVATSL